MVEEGRGDLKQELKDERKPIANRSWPGDVRPRASKDPAVYKQSWCGHQKGDSVRLVGSGGEGESESKQGTQRRGHREALYLGQSKHLL